MSWILNFELSYPSDGSIQEGRREEGGRGAWKCELVSQQDTFKSRRSLIARVPTLSWNVRGEPE